MFFFFFLQTTVSKIKHELSCCNFRKMSLPWFKEINVDCWYEIGCEPSCDKVIKFNPIQPLITTSS